MLMACHTGIGVALSMALQAIAHITTFLDVKGLMGKVILDGEVRFFAISMMLAIIRRRVVSHGCEEIFVRIGIGFMLGWAGGA